jgi:protein-S-isoprenylcysteine O-methyltransferase Ste14
MSKCRVRLILWFILAGVSVCGGLLTDIVLRSDPFPLWLRLLGLGGMLLAHFPLKRTGRLLRLMGGAEEWGCTTKLVTTDMYQCVRHPHHVGVGVFMTCLGLLIGYWWSFLFITVTQWVWVIAFLCIVEEKELLEKFGEEYKAYRQRVPMLLADPRCVVRVLSQPLYPSES